MPEIETYSKNSNIIYPPHVKSEYRNI